MKKIVLITAALLAVASVTTGCVGIGKGKAPVPVETNG
jgi:predicted small secreted protein